MTTPKVGRHPLFTFSDSEDSPVAETWSSLLKSSVSTPTGSCAEPPFAMSPDSPYSMADDSEQRVVKVNMEPKNLMSTFLVMSSSSSDEEIVEDELMSQV